MMASNVSGVVCWTKVLWHTTLADVVHAWTEASLAPSFSSCPIACEPRFPPIPKCHPYSYTQSNDTQAELRLRAAAACA
ncbi:uncharacterized protein LY79DRAFT_551610 [Colletotrichum navitas]|uniref:Secreted protein n=1 Tax=Colletotrichum navitas TaxID=681940 RepID=A0AAD8Q0M5_9PEZI|nr:uncharacterized protein LY79DRAFT_551610 [Colletotrichum navitas]KAK1593662.1 hypothetical protein LY79DRAFT_551610 [Colletotrichum navitas]